MNRMEAAKRKAFWLSWIALALLACAPAFASTLPVSHLKTRAELSADNGQFSVELPALSPATASSYYDWSEQVASESSVAPKGIPTNIGPHSAKAPRNVTPGVRELEGHYVDDLGRVQPWRAHYDEHGRLIGRTVFGDN
jgi:hypothetical protein